MSFKYKYLKYKNKYLNLKNKLGGVKIRCEKCLVEYDPDGFSFFWWSLPKTCICNKIREGAAAAKEYFESIKIGQKFHLLNKEKKDIKGRYIEIISKVDMDLSFSSLGGDYLPKLLCKINYVMENGQVYENVDITLMFSIGSYFSGIKDFPFRTIIVYANNPRINLLIPNMILGSEIK